METPFTIRTFAAGLALLVGGCSGESGASHAVADRAVGDAAPPQDAAPLSDAASPQDAGPLSDAIGPDAAVPFLDDIAAVVPGAGLPAEVVLQTANNNLDIVRHEGRLFLAFRTAPSHFASAEARLYVVSTEDEQTWRYEGEFFESTDLREPRLLSLNGHLFLYYAVLGTDRLAFEPHGMRVTEYGGPGSWTTPEWFYGEGFIPWRAKILGGRAYLMAYIGGENIYEVNGNPISVHWLTTADGRTFEPVVPDHPVVLTGGTSETDFTILDDGTVIAVARNEAGDAESGFGSKICRGEANAPATWRCNADPKRYDSPLVFRHRGEVYLFGRRNVTGDGNFDLGRHDLPLQQQSNEYAAEYWGKPKRCSLWHIDPVALTATFVLDLPSKGDTCFASVVPADPAQDAARTDDFLVYNYSSPIDGPDISWLRGQTGNTLIYRQRLHFPGAE